MTLPVAILAGGLATRLGEVTKTIPKALLDVAGKPFVVHQLELLRAHGVTRVVLCIAHLDDQIEAALGDGRAFGVDVAYSHDGPKLLGTGGALRRALPLLGERFLVLYGDSYLLCDYAHIAKTFEASGHLGLMTVYKNDGLYDASNVIYRDGVIVRYDKTDKSVPMTHIDWGLGAFRSEAFSGYPAETKLDLAAVYQDLLARGELAGYEVQQRFYEIGSVAGLEETRQLLAAKETPP
jgi:NDP-sugar pyrophosphorylase family protein